MCYSLLPLFDSIVDLFLFPLHWPQFSIFTFYSKFVLFLGKNALYTNACHIEIPFALQETSQSVLLRSRNYFLSVTLEQVLTIEFTFIF